MQAVTIWHNPKCSKSREAMEIVTHSGCKAEVIKYLENSPDENQIRTVLKMLGIKPRELMRTKEDLYKELNLKDENSDDALIEAMFKHPKLIERPIIIKGDRAIIGRPTDRIAQFLNA
ncbi:arsenate reductase (glutaredoxin) [Sulfurimonas sp.]|jgi:arsenate reductase|uniref:arsenate reductase (glutaredoxin) n=1 Tax=Sulfurimonas sp. TaxID=2022749 RepID=UPI0025D8F1F5|nr:arsenate reductase (glutaredoxin) [Sulfurimonas sp.]MCK9472528.1 arsenate reductase (glutaredoxin) [Sulfurimonas sp.]MDD3505118.1 arsenate reductase (glutaredoxin) [Sulfurimonas sp.]